MSSLQMLMAILSPPVPSGSVVMNDITITHTRPSGQANAGIGDDRDGTQERLLGSTWTTLPGGEWWSLEPESLVGTDFEIKFRRVSGRLPDSKSSWTDNVWTDFISTRHFYSILRTGTGTNTAVVEVQIRDKDTMTLQGTMEATLNAVIL